MVYVLYTNQRMMKADLREFRSSICGLFLLVLLIPFHSRVNGQEPVKIKRMTESIEFNGIPDEETWKRLYPIPSPQPKEERTLTRAFAKVKSGI